MTAPAIQRRTAGPSLAVVRAVTAASAQLGFASNPFRGVEYSPAFLAFAAYLVAIITYRFPIGTASMVIALLTLPLEKQSLRLPAVAALSFAMVAWAFFGLTTTQYPATVVTAVSDFAKVCGVVFVAINVIVTRARFRAIVVGSLILWVLFPLRGTMFAYFIYHGDVEGRAAWNYIYSNPNDLAALCLLQLGMAVGLLAVERRRFFRLGTICAVALLVLVIILTQSRGAVIALSVFGIIGGKKYFTNPKGILIIAVLAGLVFAVAPDSVWRRFSTIKGSGSADVMTIDPETVDLATRQDMGSSQQRLEIWSVARAIIAENPITGVGLGAYPDAHSIMARRPGFHWLARGRRDTHSTYLNVMAETGIVGFALFAAMIIMTIKASRGARKAMQARAPALSLQLFNMEVGLYGYLVAAIWGSYASFVPMYVHLVLMYVGSRLLHEQGGGQQVRGRRKFYPAPAPVVISHTAGASV